MDFYSIKQTSNITGISPQTLRTWETRYQVVSPRRSSSGYRMYSDKDIAKLKLINKLSILGHRIGSIAHNSLSELNKILKKHGIHEDTEEPLLAINEGSNFTQNILSSLLLALENYRFDLISYELNKLTINMNSRDLVIKILSPLLASIGEKVSKDELSISHEHALSSIIKFHLGSFIYKNYQRDFIDTKVIILATPEGELHEFGILLASLLCSHYKFKIYYLGPNLPVDALKETVKFLKATHIIIGTVLSLENQSENKLTSFLSSLSAGLTQKQKLLIGGSGLFNKKKILIKKNVINLTSFDDLDEYLKKL